MVGQAVVGGGEDQHRARQVARAETAPHQAHGQFIEFDFPFGSDYRDAGARFQQGFDFTQCDAPGAHNQNRTVFEIEEDGVVSQIAC